MILEAGNYDLDTSEPTVLMHETDCEVLGVSEGDRVRVSGKGSAVAIVSVSDTLVIPGRVLLPHSVQGAASASPGDPVEVAISHSPDSVRSIRDKMEGRHLDAEEISQLVDDVVSGRLSRIEIAAWLTALYIKGMDIDEIAAYARSMAETGDRISFDDVRVFDFHSFGGVPGNKITPIVVSIAAEAGLTIPKLSSRAISSACGTADFVETFCDVDLDSDDVRRIASDVGGVFSWTGATDLVMDIPLGSETKVRTIEEARSYARDLVELGHTLGIRVECIVTYAEQPLGRAVGPILEARECMRVLEGDPGYADVADKACICAGALLDLAGSRNGAAEARRILESGRARSRFAAIVAAQGGDPCVRSDDMVPGMYTAEVVADRPGFVRRISNSAIVSVAKAAGAPGDKGAGVLVERKVGSKVSEGDVLMRIHAEREDKLAHALEIAEEYEPIVVEGMIISHVGPGQ